MSQYPVEIPYSFSVDLSIRENQIPFVKTSVLTDNLSEEPIDFTPNQDVPIYFPTWYVYGDDDLLYVGTTLEYRYDPLLYYGGYLSLGNEWRGKYSFRHLSRVYYEWFEVYPTLNTKSRLFWRKGEDDKWRINTPIDSNLHPDYDVPENPYPDFPYSTITVKRNIMPSTEDTKEIVASGTKATIASKVLDDNDADFSSITDDYHYVRITAGTNVMLGIYKITAHTSTTLTLDSNPGDSDTEDVIYSISESYAIVQAINPSYDVPSYYTFPNLTKRMYRRYPNVQMTTSKLWLKVGINKYRLIVYGRFYKWTNKQIKEGEGNYIEGTYEYIPYNFITPFGGAMHQYWSIYKLDSYTETSKNIKLYEPEYNPSNVRLLVNYVNNSGQNEIRQYTIQA